ncbi:NAD(P)H-binding protein [Actinoplanes sp. HUAS TT8]|uniref:NAD(P)H-binding protein n=1 Tax=Actinoplanes sp. HUAS TT8 TaxID=3447453 RepID=UPI003F51D944
MTITVTTPTGNVGSRVTQLLIQAGIRPHLLVRDPAKLAPHIRAAAHIHTGDLRDPDFLRTATTGTDALFWATPENFGADDPLAEMATIVDAGTAAVRANHIPRTVLISSIGAELGHGAGLIDGLARSEHEFTATGTQVLTLRCGYYFTNLLAGTEELRTGHLSTNAPPDHPTPWVDPRDIGDIAATRLLNPHTSTGIQAVHGPADLTWTEVAAILSVTLHIVPDDTVTARLRQAGLTPKAAAAVLAMTTGLRHGFTPAQPRTPLTTTPTTLKSWAATMLPTTTPAAAP